MINRSIAAAALVGLLFLSGPVAAAIVSVTDPTSPGGTDNVTRDTATGLEWLDWTATTNLTYFQVLAEQAVGQSLEGWVHASSDQLKTLYSHIAGTPDVVANWPQITGTPDDGAVMQLIAGYVGFTDVTDPISISSAITSQTGADFAGVTTHVPTTISSDYWAGQSTLRMSSGRVPDDSALIERGHALVRAWLPGDLNGDRFVGIQDLNIVLGAWNQSVPPANPLADPNGDNFVGIVDLNTVLGNWNAGTPPTSNATIPEPATALLIATGAIMGVCKRRMNQTRSTA